MLILCSLGHVGHLQEHCCDVKTRPDFASHESTRPSCVILAYEHRVTLAPTVDECRLRMSMAWSYLYTSATLELHGLTLAKMCLPHGVTA